MPGALHAAVTSLTCGFTGPLTWLDGTHSCGRYFEDCNEAAVVTCRSAGYAGVAWYAVDSANAERLWDTALGLLQV
jgi:hypothetical protein